MAALRAFLHITVDGVVEAPEHWGARYVGTLAAAYEAQQLETASALVVGRRTYEELAAAWPNRPRGSSFADRMNAIPKYVVTATERTLGWKNARALVGDGIATVERLKDTVEGDLLVYGSASLTRSLLASGLVDELRLCVHPLAVGAGRRLFLPEAQIIRFRLSGCQPLDNGVVVLCYLPD